MKLQSAGLYKKYIKRIFDIALSFSALVLLSPVLLGLTVIGAIFVRGNPFFIQSRPGKNEKIFKLVKFRTMTNQKGKDGKLLSDEKRLTCYGRLLRSTSLDELPELYNILKGEMSFVGPRPLLVEYLPMYSKEQRHRHDVRPGLTGLAQINGRNAVNWAERFRYDIDYIDNITFMGDLKIFFCTIKKVLVREGINSGTTVTMEPFRGEQK